MFKNVAIYIYIPISANINNNSCTEKPWWILGDKSDPFNSGVLYVKRKVGACSYVDDPIGCQSLLSRAMHKVGASFKNLLIFHTLHRLF